MTQKISLFNFQPYEAPFLDAANQTAQLNFQCLETRLTPDTAPLARGSEVVCCFVNDQIDATVIQQLAKYGVQLIALRSAGFNHVDLAAAAQAGLTVVRVPAYSPYAVAEFAVGMILSLNRKIHHAHQHVHEQNFLLKGLLGFDLHGKTVGVIGTGHIGAIFCKIMLGFGCRVLASDPYPNQSVEALGIPYVPLTELYQQSDIISIHCPLTEETMHLIDESAINQMRPGVMLINTSRGKVIDTRAVIEGLKNKKIGYLGLDVYEEEEHLFFKDLSEQVLTDDVYARLETFPNVLLTAHQAFFTEEALTHIFETTVNNIQAFFAGQPVNTVEYD